MSSLEKQVSGILQQSLIIGIVIVGSYYYTKIPTDLEQIKMVAYGAIGTMITTTLPLYLVRRRRSKLRPFMSSENMFDVAYHTHTYADTKKLQVYIGTKIPSLFCEPFNHYFLPQWLEVCDIDLNRGLFEFGDITMNSNVSEMSNLKKVPRGLKITGTAASDILTEVQRIVDKKKMSLCDKKYLDVYYSIKEAGVLIEKK